MEYSEGACIGSDVLNLKNNPLEFKGPSSKNDMKRRINERKLFSKNTNKMEER